MSIRKEMATMFRLNWLRTIYLGLTCLWIYLITGTFTLLS